MKQFLSAIAIAGFLAAPVDAREWKVRDVTVKAGSGDSKLELFVSKARLQIVRPTGKAVLHSIDPKEVVSIWYDNKYVTRSYGRDWWNIINELCRTMCGDLDATTPLALLAAGGIGYLAAEPFSERQHFVNIRYRAGDRVDWVTLGTSWFDHFWLMTDLSSATGLAWLNMPLQRAKLFWSFGDHTYAFQTWATNGDAEVPGGDYDVLLWEDGAGKGVLMVFSGSGQGVPRTVAAEPVVIEQAGATPDLPEYCRDEQGIRRLRRISLKKKRLVLPAWDAACRRAQREAVPEP